MAYEEEKAVVLRQRVARTNRVETFRFEGFDFVKFQGGPLHECVYSLLDSLWNGDSGTLMLCGQPTLLSYLECLVQEVGDRIHRASYLNQQDAKFRLNLEVVHVTERAVLDLLSKDLDQLQVLSNGSLDPAPAQFDVLSADNLKIAINRVKRRDTSKAHVVANLSFERLLKSRSKPLLSPRKIRPTQDGWFPILSEIKLVQVSADQAELQKSFTSLCRCLREPGMGFRDSKLTQVLRPSFQCHVRCIVLGKVVTPTNSRTCSIRAVKLCVSTLKALKQIRGSQQPFVHSSNLVVSSDKSPEFGLHIPMKKILESYRNSLQVDSDRVYNQTFTEVNESKVSSSMFSLGDEFRIQGEHTEAVEEELNKTKRSFYRQMEKLQSENSYSTAERQRVGKARSKSLNDYHNSVDLDRNVNPGEESSTVQRSCFLEMKVAEMDKLVRQQAKEIQSLQQRDTPDPQQELIDNLQEQLETVTTRECDLKVQLRELKNKLSHLNEEFSAREDAARNTIRDLQENLSLKTKEAAEQREQLLLAEAALLKARELQISANQRTRQNLKLATKLKAELLKERALRVTCQDRLDRITNSTFTQSEAVSS